MELIHRYDNKEDKWFNELYDEGELIKKEEAEKEPEYDLFEVVQLQGEKYIITDISRSLYSATRLIIEVEKHQDYLDKSTLIKCEDGEYRTMKEQKEMKLSEFAIECSDVELTPYQQKIIDEIHKFKLQRGRLK